MKLDPRERLAFAIAWVLIALATIPAAIAPLWDADVWWVLRAGGDFLREGSVPTRNRYGFTASEHPWIMHEWGFGALYALLATRGLGMLALVRVAAVSITSAMLAWRSFREARPWLAAVCVSLALGVFGGRFESPRPVGMTYPLAVTLAAVAFDPVFSRAHAVASVLLVLAWTNLHGSFPLGIVMLSLGLGVPGGARRARWGALSAAMLTTLCNPYGLQLHALVLRYATGADGDVTAVVHARVVEWYPLWRAPLRLATPYELSAAAALTVLWGVSLRDARWRARALLGLLLTVMALRHGRHLQLAGMVGCVLAPGPLESLVARGAWTLRETQARAVAAFGVLPLVFGGTLWVIAGHRSEGAWTDITHQDEAATALLAAMPEDARVFVEFPFAGYAVWRRRQVYFDPRNDCYPASVLREAFDINDGLTPPAVALDVLRARGTTHALVRCTSRAARALSAAHWIDAREGLCVYELSMR